MRPVALALIFASCFAVAQQKDVLSTEAYQEPPTSIKEAVTAPWWKNRSVSNLDPAASRYFTIERDGPPALAQLARPYENLAGVQIDAIAARRRATNLLNQRRLVIRNLDDDKAVTYEVPASDTISDASWSPDGSTIALLRHTPKQSRLVLVDAKNGREQRSWGPVTNVGADAFDWTGDGKLVALMVPENRKLPAYADVPDSPRVRVSDNRPTRLRTLAGLLDSPTDANRLEALMTSQLTVIDPKGGVASIGKPSPIIGLNPSPDAKWFLVTLLDRPYSYFFGFGSFPRRELLWNDKGEQVAEISKRALQAGETDTTTPPPAAGGGPRAGAPAAGDGRRGLAWRFDGAGLTYLQLEPRATRKEGEPEPRRKDRIMLWSAPFGEKDAKAVYTSETPITAARFSGDGTRVFVTTTESGRTKVLAVKLDDPSKPVTITETGGAAANAEDAPPVGTLATKPGPKADTVVRTTRDGKFAFLTGSTPAADPDKEGPRPYVDRVNLETGAKERLFEGRGDKFEQPSFLDDDMTRFLVNRQSRTEIGQTFLVTRDSKAERQLTQNEDFLPDLTQARREQVQVTRPDGIKFWVTVTLPRFAGPNAKLPALFWFYPNEYADQRAYDRSRRNRNPNLFPTISSQNKAILLRLGYALVDPDCPLIGSPTTVNNTYVPQLRNNLSATIDALDRLGYIDRTRLALGGHSYGAFSTLNAMIHTPFFKAGLAGSGNYNRSLTPFGFQSEPRSLWESREMYMEVSPLMHLDDLTGAVLLTHGMDDQNMGTAPVNSERLFQALEALGKPAALAMYPYEDHGQVARETVLDMWARWVAWLEKYLKG